MHVQVFLTQGLFLSMDLNGVELISYCKMKNVSKVKWKLVKSLFYPAWIIEKNAAGFFCDWSNYWFYALVLASDKPDLGLEELSSLNMRSRFQVFEKGEEEVEEQDRSVVTVKRSSSILSKLARFVWVFHSPYFFTNKWRNGIAISGLMYDTYIRCAS